MLDQASSRVRELVAACRSHAMLGNQLDALHRLDDALDGSKANTEPDRLVLLMAKVEILHWDCRDAEALQLFRNEIDGLTEELPEDVSIAVSYNRNDVALALLEHDDFYNVFDRSRIANVDLWGYRAYYEMAEAAAAGKHYDALPAVWEELVRAHQQGCWRPYCAAARLMAMECLQLGWLSRAVYHAVVAGQKATAHQVGDYLLANGVPDNLAESVSMLLACANPQRHFLVGCEIIVRMADAVPDQQVADVAKWILSRASSSPCSIGERHTLESAWKTLVAISSRLDSTQSQSVVEMATQHDAWKAPITNKNQVIMVRKDMVKAVGGCVDRLPRACIDNLIDECVPLAIERKQDYDYGDAIELLCRLANCGGAEAKSKVRGYLYPKGQRLNTVLLQVARFFDVDIKDKDALTQDAEMIARHIRLQVQRVSSNGAVQPIPGSQAYHTIPLDGETLYVHLVNAASVEAIVRNRHRLSNDTLSSLVDAILDMIVETENLVANKVNLVQTLYDMGDSCSDVVAQKIFAALSPIAQGEIVEPTHTMSSAESANPLNRFKMGMGSPSDLHGVALYALALIERDQPGVFGRKLDRLVEHGLTSIDPVVRSFAYAAAREKPTLSTSEFTALILGTRDDDTAAAGAAFGGMADKKGANLTRPQWHLLISSAKIASRSRAVDLRRAAAYTCARLVEQAPGKALKKSLEDLVVVFSRDTCHSVRHAAASKDTSSPDAAM